MLGNKLYNAMARFGGGRAQPMAQTKLRQVGVNLLDRNVRDDNWLGIWPMERHGGCHCNHGRALSSFAADLHGVWQTANWPSPSKMQPAADFNFADEIARCKAHGGGVMWRANGSSEFRFVHWSEWAREADRMGTFEIVGTVNDVVEKAPRDGRDRLYVFVVCVPSVVDEWLPRIVSWAIGLATTPPMAANIWRHYTPDRRRSPRIAAKTAQLASEAQ